VPNRSAKEGAALSKQTTIALLLVMSLLPAGCRTELPSAAEPRYDQPLAPGTIGLRLITDPAELPDLKAAYATRDDGLIAALDRSIYWFSLPSSQRAFPMIGISHERAAASVQAFRDLLTTSASAEQFERRLLSTFDVYTSVGWNGRGVVLFTGYYSPIFDAALEPNGEYQYPLYRRPNDLVSDPQTGRVLVPYPNRATIEQSHMLTGGELVWLKSRLDAYLIHVQGSGQLRLRDGRTMYVGFAGTNGHEYTSIGRELVRDGKLAADKLSLPALREYFARHPNELDAYIQRNDRFVFFQTYDGTSWPAGSMGLKVQPWRTLATDKSVFPRGGVVMVDTNVPALHGGERSVRGFRGLLLDQDTGGAIRAPGRADIYMGIGDQAEQLAGRQYAEGRLYYFFIKPVGPGLPGQRHQ
jgi:membrane-bound lytic murein transglycosylase A